MEWTLDEYTSLFKWFILTFFYLNSLNSSEKNSRSDRHYSSKDKYKTNKYDKDYHSSNFSYKSQRGSDYYRKNGNFSTFRNNYFFYFIYFKF
jgi:hypothetical protein